MDNIILSILKRRQKKIVHSFNIHFHKNMNFLKLRTHCDQFEYLNDLFSEQESIKIKENKFCIDNYSIKPYIFTLVFDPKNLTALSKYPEGKKINNFILKSNELELFPLFLEQLNILLNTYSNITNIQELSELIFQPQSIFQEKIDSMENNIFDDDIGIYGFVLGIYKLYMYTGISENYRTKLEKVFENFNKKGGEYAKSFKETENITQAVKIYLQNRKE